MLTAMRAVANIISGRKDKSNIWEANIDAEYHEEKQAPAEQERRAASLKCSFRHSEAMLTSAAPTTGVRICMADPSRPGDA